MFAHIGMLTLQPGTTDGQKAGITDALESLVGTVPGLVSAVVTHDLGLREGNADLMFRMELLDRSAWEGYSVHPAHVAVIKEHIGPVVAGKMFLQVEV